MNNSIFILGWGFSTGSVIITNDDLVQFPPSSRPTIEAKTGILARRHIKTEEATSDLAVLAARRALESSGVFAHELTAIIVATSTPDHPLPSTAAIVQGQLQAIHAGSFDLNAVCSGGVYALAVAHGLAISLKGPVLVIGADAYSKILNPKDFSTYPYFGDGAGAVVIGPIRNRPALFIDMTSVILGADGTGHNVIKVPAGGSREPALTVTEPDHHYFKMAGRQVYDFAIDKGTMMVKALTHVSGGPEKIHRVVLHQANINIIKEISTRSCIPLERFPTTLERFGNTAAAGTFITLAETLDATPVPPGTSVILAAFGGGLAWAGLRLTAPSTP